MNTPLFSNSFEVIKVPLDHPTFYARTFSLIAKQRKRLHEHDPNEIKKTLEEEDELLSRTNARAKIQEGSAFRALNRVRKLVYWLVDDKGDLNIVAVSQTIESLKNSLYSLGPERQFDAKHQKNLLNSLTLLQESKEMQILLKKVSAPYMNRYAEQLIRETLKLPGNRRINDPETKRAFLTVWFCLLRQSVGSCFATAPAILVHDQQPAQLFKDLIEILGTGRLKRIYGGIEYSVPLVTSWGAGDLRRPMMLSSDTDVGFIEPWASPGLIDALVAADLISEKLPLKERITQAKILLLPHVKPKFSENTMSIVTAEELLKNVLLNSLDLKPEELLKAESKSAFVGSMMMNAVETSSSKGSTRTTFHTKFHAACSAFKIFSENALLKSWEFTLASFAEIKSSFTRWNLYSSLGFEPEENGGIGFVIHQMLQGKLEQVNRQSEEIKIEHENALVHLRYLETRMRSANSEKDEEWMKSEYRTRRYEFSIIEERFQLCQYHADIYSKLLNHLINFYSDLFPRYFQEVYDADMRGLSPNPYDDSPAGFHLLYKHGRSNTAQWDRIETPTEFIEALASFFISSEMEIQTDPSMKNLENVLSEITTAVVLHVRTTEFLETAFHRMARAHRTAPIKDPLKHLDKIDKKPWAYTSGGNMETLVSSYWKRENPPTEVSRWVESPTELLVFLVDTLKQMNPKVSLEFEKDPEKSLIMHSPTHAFLLKPGLSPFKELWKNPEFTYTHIRDNIIEPAGNFISQISLDQAMAHYLIDKLAQKVPENYRHYFKQVFNYVPIGISPPEFRNHLVYVMNKERGLGYGRVLSADTIDEILFSELPLFSSSELKERIQKVFKKLPNIGPSLLSKLETLWEELPIEMLPGAILGAQNLKEIVMSFLCLLYGTTSSAFDYHLHVSQVCKKLGYALPMPTIVADTNWVRDEFGFVVNPGSGQLEFWRVDYTGSVGAPISTWDKWLNGSTREPTWGVYINPQEYSS
ncbi:MAG: hypothetical protein H0T62_01845 [Parachlamydiaceae bacterium]|nr:hypothetical protein [Parachlamydiaceae bacterium]